MASKYYFVSAARRGQIKWIKLRKLKTDDGKFIVTICTWMRSVGGKWWMLGSWRVAGTED